MNANELADKLENTISLGYPSKMESQEVIAMLRQQQAEIKTLKLQNDNYWVMIEILRQKVKAQEK